MINLQPEEMRAVIMRMKRAHGHLARVIRMLEEGVDCEDVLIQLAAVSKAINRSGYAVVATGLRHCVTDGDGTRGADAAKLEKLFLTLA